MKHYIIGAGGVGSWLAPSLCLLIGKEQVVLVDGDKLEESNLNRQLFTDSDLGSNKAEALSKKYGCEFIPAFYDYGLVGHKPTDWIFGCVDNNAARMAILNACDDFGCKCIIGANETHSSESYMYNPEWKDTKLDPRKFYPELLNVKEGDPLKPQTCTGEAQRANVQLVSANFSAAALVQHMYVAWGMEALKLNPESHQYLPHRLISNLSKISSISVANANA